MKLKYILLAGNIALGMLFTGCKERESIGSVIEDTTVPGCKFTRRYIIEDLTTRNKEAAIVAQYTFNYTDIYKSNLRQAEYKTRAINIYFNTSFTPESLYEEINSLGLEAFMVENHLDKCKHCKEFLEEQYAISELSQSEQNLEGTEYEGTGSDAQGNIDTYCPSNDELITIPEVNYEFIDGTLFIHECPSCHEEHMIEGN